MSYTQVHPQLSSPATDDAILVSCGDELGPDASPAAAPWGCVAFDHQIDCGGDLDHDGTADHWMCAGALTLVECRVARGGLLHLLPAYLAVVRP